jgi:hypothetical protein
VLTITTTTTTRTTTPMIIHICKQKQFLAFVVQTLPLKVVKPVLTVDGITLTGNHRIIAQISCLV